jgi:uncharacterized protein YjbI with pentapeptide repeats
VTPEGRAPWSTTASVRRVPKRRETHLPRIDPLVLRDLPEGDPEALHAGARLDGERFEHVRLDADLRGLVLDGCEVHDATGEETRLDGGRVLESVLDRIQLTALSAKGSTWRDVRVTGSRVGAAEWFDSDWTAVELIGCRIGYLNLAGSRIQDLRCTDCVLDELDLRDASVRRASFEGCRVGALSVAGATLEHVDLTGAELGTVDHATGLRGVVLDESQLAALSPLLAEALGITVR